MEAAVNAWRSRRRGFPLIEKREDVGVGQGAGGLKLTVFLAEEELAGGIENGDGGNAALERYIVLLSEIGVFFAAPDIHVDDYKIFIEDGGDFATVKGIVESVAVEAPIGAEDDKNTFVREQGGMERFVYFLFGVDTGGIEIFFLGSLTPSCGAGGCGEGQGEWMQENQEQCERKGFHRKSVSRTWIGGVNERKGVTEEVGSLHLG
jgi:hypothetical protein